MKKVVLSLGMLTGLASVAPAQEARFGLKAGVSLSSVTGIELEEGPKNLLGGTAGVMADFSFSDLISFHPELLFSQKGFKLDDGGTKTRERTSYIDLPLLVRVKADGLFFEAGPQAGLLVARKTETTFPVASASPATTNTSTNGARKLDLGYIVGVGYQLPQGLELGIRYNGGISDRYDPSGGARSRNSVFQLQVGYLFEGK